MQERALVESSAVTRIPPTVLSYLCSSFLGSVECVTILQCCRAWCLRGADRQLLQHMLAEASSHTSAVIDGADEQTVDGDFYRTPHGQLPSVELPWRQRHMESVQHVLVQLQIEGISEPRILPSFVTLPPPSTAPPAFTIVDSPFELRWSTRRMRPELVVVMRIKPLAPGVNPVSASVDSSEQDMKLQSDLWPFLSHAFRSSPLPLAVTIVDERTPMQVKRKGAKQSQTVGGVHVGPNEIVDRPASTLALSARWLPDPVVHGSSSDGSASSFSGPPVSSSSLTGIPLRLHSLVFHTYRHDFICAVIEAMRTFTDLPASSRFQKPALSEAHRQWYVAATRVEWAVMPAARIEALNLLTPLNVVCYRSTDPLHPPGLPIVLRSLLARPTADHLPHFTIDHAIHTLYIDVEHAVDIVQILRPMPPRYPHPQEMYLIGVQPKRVGAAFEGVRTLVLRPPRKDKAEATRLDFNAVFAVLVKRMRGLDRIELVNARFSSPALLRAWCPRATSIRLEQCVFDDDDGLIDLESHAKSLWPLPPVQGVPVRPVPRFLLTPGRPSSLFKMMLDVYCRHMAMAWMMLPFVLMCLGPTLGVDVVLSYLPLARFTRVINLSCFSLLSAGLAFVFFSLLVSEWNSFDAVADEFHSPPSAQMYVRNSVVLFLNWMTCVKFLLFLPWDRAGIDPVTAVVSTNVCKMLFNSLSSANTASWIRVQRAKMDWRAFIRYFVRLAIVRTVQLRWFMTTYAGLLWINTTGIVRKDYHLQPHTAFGIHSLAQRLFVDEHTCVASIEYVAPSRVAPLLWTECRTLVSRLLRDANIAGWVWSWLDNVAWAQWSRAYIAHLIVLLRALPYILALATALFALQQLVRKIRRSIAPNVPLMITEPLRLASVVLKW